MSSATEPFLRWAGGKRWLGPALSKLVSARLSRCGTYFEPFLGSGAVFFATQPTRAVLSDLNEDLILAYNEIAKRPHDVISRLLRLPSDTATYYSVRESRPTSSVQRAARLVYLNRNCYRGIYRENRSGQFNVPFGGGDRNHLGICTDGTILRCSESLAHPGVRIQNGDFENFIAEARAGDVIYCDPTYRKVTREHFDRYGKIVFSWSDQERLARLCAAAYERGVTVLISNACCDDLRGLYPEAVVFLTQRKPGITSRNGGVARGEYLLVLDPQRRYVRNKARDLMCDGFSLEDWNSHFNVGGRPAELRV